VLGSRDARFQVPQGHRRRLREGGKLAVTVEPAGGAPRGKATGPVGLRENGSKAPGQGSKANVAR
jgi:anti-sigma-K factor RskA